MTYLKCFLVSIALLGLAGCDLTSFESTWRDPSARPINIRNEHVAALLLSPNESVRRPFEHNLAKELNMRGVESTPGYRLLNGTDATDKEAILADLQATSVDHAVFMRIVDRHLEANYVPDSALYPGVYDPFYWQGGVFGSPWPSYSDFGYYQINEIVSVETLVYDVPQGKLVWAGLSETMNPDEVDDFVEELVSGAVKEMRKTGFFPAPRKSS